ncbi:MAG: hypothetical protein ABR597_08440 [Bacteroidales bacterium]
MTKETLIKETLKTLSQLPDMKVKEVSEFASLLLKKYEEEILQSGIETLVSKSQTYSFLKEEEDLYTVEDLKEKYK